MDEDEKKEGLDAKNSYIPNQKHEQTFSNSITTTKNIIYYPPDQNVHPHENEKNGSPIMAIVFGSLAMAISTVSFFVYTVLLGIVGIVFATIAFDLGVKTKLTGGKLAATGAIFGILALCLSVVALSLHLIGGILT